MRVSFKAIGASAFVFAMAFACCATAKGQPDSPGSRRCAFAPAARKDAAVTVAVCLEKGRLFKVVDVFLDNLFDLVEIESAEEVESLRLGFGEFKKEPFFLLDANSRRFLRENGLYDADLRWGVLSMDNLLYEKGELKPQGLSLAVAGNIDLGKIIKGVREKSLTPFCDMVGFEEMTVADEKAWRVMPLDAEVAKSFKEMAMDPCVASLDGQLVLVAQSPETLARQIRLYRHGEGKGDALGNFPSGTDFMRVHVSDIGRIVRDCAGDELQDVNKVIPNGDKVVTGLKTLAVDIKASSEGALQPSLALDAASEQDADVLRTFAKTGLMSLRAQMVEASPDVDVEDYPLIPHMTKLLEGVKICGENGRIEVAPDGALVVAFAASVYTAASAIGNAFESMFSNSKERAALREMIAGGRSLVQGMIQAHAGRRGKRVPVWPRARVGNGELPADDATSRLDSSATDFFNGLFDMAHYGTSEWAPSVEGKLLDALGKDAVAGKSIRAERLNWCIAANVTDETPDFMPVLISANFNPALLLRKWDGKTDRFTHLPIGPASGAAKSMFGNRSIIVVRKDGRVKKVKAESLTYFLLFKRKAFDLSGKKPPLVYLTPTGIAEPVGHRGCPFAR